MSTEIIKEEQKEEKNFILENGKFSEVQNCLPSFLFDSIENLEEENESSTEGINSNELSNSKSSEEQKNLDNNNIIIEDSNFKNNNFNSYVQNIFNTPFINNNNINFIQLKYFNYVVPNLFYFNNPELNFYNNKNSLLKKIQNDILNNNNNQNYKKKVKKNIKNHKNENLSLEKILLLQNNDFYSYITTQKGSREIQNYLKKISSKEIDLIINKIQFNFPKILIDKYGNYFSQKLIEISCVNQRLEIIKYLKNNFIEISNNCFGTHPIQILIEIITTLEEKKLISDYIKNNEIILSLDSKGTHVLQKFISITKDEERKIINENLINNISKLIYDPFGVCVLIKLIKNTNNKKIKEKLANYIIDNNPMNFIQHPFANYAVQSLFNQNDIIYCKDIIKVIVENFYILSMKKFSSNVVENCIKFGNENVSKIIYKEIIEKEKLGNMLNNTYGNFVIEKLISKLNKEEKNKLIKEIEKCGKEKCLSNTIMNLLYK